MERKEQEAALEAVLFAVGESVEEKRLSEIIGESQKKTREILEGMKARWNEEGRGVTLLCLDQSWQMCTRPEMYEYLIRIAKRLENIRFRIRCWKRFPLSPTNSR